MSTTVQEALGYSDEDWAPIQDAMEKAIEGSAKCRQVIPKGEDEIGKPNVTVPTVNPGAPICYGPDVIASPIHIYVDVDFDDQHLEVEQITRLIEVGGALLGAQEDEEIVQGQPPAPARGRAAAAPVRAARNALHPALARSACAAAGGAPIAIGAGGAPPSGAQVCAAVATAVASLENANRPGRFGLILHNNLMAILRQPRGAGGGPPIIQEVEEIIGSNSITGTGALSGTFNNGEVCGILFRLEPTAMDRVYTMLPKATSSGRQAGLTPVRIEEQFVLRILDPAAIQRIEY